MPTDIAFARIKGNNVIFYDAKGRQVKTALVFGAVSAQSTGDGVAITLKNGSVRLYDRYGTPSRTII